MICVLIGQRTLHQLLSAPPSKLAPFGPLSDSTRLRNTWRGHVGGEHGGNVSAMENVWLSLAEEEVENLLCLCAIGFLGWQILRIDCSRATSIVEGRGFEGVSSIQRWLIERNSIEIPEVVFFVLNV